eukprot:4306615-Prymnesium_polylepis.2
MLTIGRMRSVCEPIRKGVEPFERTRNSTNLVVSPVSRCRTPAHSGNCARGSAPAAIARTLAREVEELVDVGVDEPRIGRQRLDVRVDARALDVGVVAVLDCDVAHALGRQELQYRRGGRARVGRRVHQEGGVSREP